MNKPDALDRQALVAAQQYMGKLAWPTVLLGVTVGLAYVATPLLLIAGVIPLAVAFVLMTVATYAAYTVLHEAAHGSISGSHTSLRWLNEALGYIAAWILMIPLTAHRHEHLAHHRNTNKPDEDPDFIVANMARSPLHAARAAVQVFASQHQYYYKHRWGKGPRAQDRRLCLEVAAALVPRLAFVPPDSGSRGSRFLSSPGCAASPCCCSCSPISCIRRTSRWGAMWIPQRSW